MTEQATPKKVTSKAAAGAESSPPSEAPEAAGELAPSTSSEAVLAPSVEPTPKVKPPEPAPVEEVADPYRVRVREDAVHVINHQKVQLKKGDWFHHNAVDVQLMLRQGVQLDAVDDDGEVLLDLNADE